MATASSPRPLPCRPTATRSRRRFRWRCSTTRENPSLAEAPAPPAPHASSSKDMSRKVDVVICGAGIAGIAAAYHLSVKRGIKKVVIVDEREPMTLTSDKGTQGYRNWWPGPDDTMLKLVSHSIDLMEDSATRSGNTFRMNRRGYLFATAMESKAAELETSARQVSSYGMGELRVHRTHGAYMPHRAEGFSDAPTGAGLL